VPDIRARAAYLAYRGAAEVARGLPRVPGALLARSLSLGMTAAWATKRRQVARHLQRATRGRLQGSELALATAAVFDNYARYWHELFRLPHEAPEAIERGMESEGFEHIEASAAAGRGTILALPHLGNWDYAGAWLAGRGFPPTVVAEPLDPPELYEWFVDLRRVLGMEVIALGPNAARGVLRALADNKVVCLLCDRDLSGDGVPVEFFGEMTTLPGGPATLAIRSGATLLPVGNYFRPRARHRVRILPPVPTERAGRLRDDVQRVTRELAGRFEDLVSAAPEQWLLMQPNWPSDTAPTIGARAAGEKG
jgi:KDO2-lipid IV(A) lauroyltransferase